MRSPLHTASRLAAAALFLCAGTAGAETWSPDEWLALGNETNEIREFDVSRAASKITIDGELDEQAWTEATVIDLPYEWFPTDNERPPVRTDCLVTYTDDYLYVAFKAFDPDPSQIRAHLMDRDDIVSYVQDDHVGVNIDTFNDERQALQFRVNPMGVQLDGTFDEFEGLEDFAWDAIWDSAAKITTWGYSVEMAIPLAQMRFPATQEAQTWGFEAFRNYPRNDRHRIASKYTDRNKECTLCQENKITGFEGLVPGKNIEIVPTVTGVINEVRDNFPDGDLETADEDAEFGVTARWGFRPNLALQATVNPDFSQVEADEAQLAVNTRFALFFPEKRPFFLEGADFFETPLNMVFTRTMADPNWGVKLTGKEGKGAIGAYFVEDDVTNILIPGNQGSQRGQLGFENEQAVLRYRHDIGARSTIGLLYTGREGEDYSNQVAGVDAFIAFNQSNVMRVQYVTTDTEYPVELGLAPEVDGDGFIVNYLHQTRNWFFRAIYQDLDEGFRADSGFVPRVDIKSAEATLQRAWWGTRDTWYRRWTLGIGAERVENQAGQTTDEVAQAFITFNGPYQSAGELNISTRDEFFAGQTFSLDRVQVNYNMKPSGKFRWGIVLRAGENIDFTNAQEGDEIAIQPGFQLRIGRHLNWRFDYLKQTLEVDEGDVFDVDIAQTTLVYQFNVRTFVRAIFQYQNLERDAEVFPFPVNTKQEDLLTQLLFSYKINPQTVLFLGYNENGFGTQDFSITETDRAIFLKVGYAFIY